ncbi:MAG: DUF1552 domain-containing protein [Verrucomicrobiota bacterium]
MPFLASLLPAGARVAAEEVLVSGTPKRLLWMAMGHGHMEEHFYPTETGRWSDIQLPTGFGALERNLNHVTMVSNLSNNENQQPHGGSEALLTCANVVGFPGKAKHNSVSCDQVAAAHLGADTRYESLQLDTQDKGGEGHAGTAMSFRQDGSAIPGHQKPLAVYHKLFGGNISKEEQLHLLENRKSIFDVLNYDSSSIKRTLSREDAEKLDEYMTSVRDVETALSREEAWINVPKPKANVKLPGEGMTGEQDIRMMFKLIVTAYQTDSTRVITYRMPGTSLLQGMGIGYNPHALSHYGTNTMVHSMNEERTKKLCELFSDFIDDLRGTKDPLDPNGGTIFDNSMVYYGGGLRTAHRTLNVPALLTGGAFKDLEHGQHRKAQKENTPLANLWTTMLQDAGVPIDRFADANATASSILS